MQENDSLRMRGLLPALTAHAWSQRSQIAESDIRPDIRPDIWRSRITDIRQSMSGIRPDTGTGYKKMAGTSIVIMDEKIR